MLRKERKWNNITSSTKARKDRKRVKTKIGSKKKSKEQEIVTNIININLTISIIILNSNALNIPIKRVIFSMNDNTRPNNMLSM